MMFSPEQRFLVTGASSGIGEGVARRLCELGATVIGIGRDRARLEAMREKSAAPERVFVECRDLAEDVGGLTDYVCELRERHGLLSGFVACAGIGEIGPLRAWDYEKERRFFDVDYFAPLALLKGVCDKRNNVGAGVSCVLMSSAAVALADKGLCTYVGAKAALQVSCRTLAKELAPRRVRINTVAPTAILTPMTLGCGEAYVESQRPRYPMGFGEVADVTHLIAFLLSDEAKWISGQNYIVDCASF